MWTIKKWIIKISLCGKKQKKKKEKEPKRKKKKRKRKIYKKKKKAQSGDWEGVFQYETF